MEQLIRQPNVEVKVQKSEFDNNLLGNSFFQAHISFVDQRFIR